MTLNQLAWEMWERLDYKEIDPSVVSRVLRGQRLFTQKQLVTFSQILKLNKIQLLAIKSSRDIEITNRFGVTNEASFLEGKVFIDLIKQNIQRITEFNFLGKFGLMEDWVNSLRELIEIKAARGLNPDILKEVLYQKALILILQNHIIMTVKSGKRVSRKVLQNAKEVINIAKELKTPHLIGSANMNIGDAYFVTGSHDDAVKYLSQSIPFLKVALKRLLQVGRQ